MNQSIFDLFYSLSRQSALLDWLIKFGANYLGWILIAFILYDLLRSVEKRLSLKRFALLASGSVIVLALSGLIKNLTDQARPFVSRPDVVALIPHVADGSFPSAHAALFMFLAVLVWRVRRSWRLWYLAGAILISVSRVSAGLHWPSDILAGWLLGFLVAICVARLLGYNRPNVAA